jgi:hypothetical protein
VQPLGSTGRFTVASLKAATIASYLQDALPFTLASGTLDLGGEYRLAIAEPLGLNVDLPSVKLRDFAIAPKNGDVAAPWITVPELDVTNVAFSLADRTLAVERVAVGNAKLSVWREADGSLNLQKLMPQQAAGAPATPAASAAPAAAAPQVPAFTVSVATVALNAASVDIEDRAVQPSVKIALMPIALTVSGYSTAPDNKLAIDASVGVNGKGTVTAKGGLALSPLVANFDIDAGNIDLPPIQPYLAQSTGLVLMSGQVSAKTKIAYAAEPARGQPGLKVAGEVTVANLATQDTALHQDFIKWRQLRVAGIDYQQGPDRLSIDRIEAHEPYGRVVISADQMLNVAAVLNPPGKTSAAAQAEPAAVPAPKPAPAKPQTPPMPMRIGTIVVDNGSANFADFSVEPNFATAIQNLSGTVTGLSSAPNSRATVKLNGNVDRFAPVDITGTVNVLSAAVYTDIAMNFRNMELTTFNPYSGKYAGYNIAKGKLTTELKYKVENRKLDAQHHIVLDQLEFGAATNSKNAVPLPIRLAVALLKDRNGVIDLNLPVGGSLDDPSFRVGPIIWQVFVGLVTKIVTAPFALIGSLFGGGEDLAYVDFAAGSSTLTQAETEKLSKVAKALAERPELKLDIPLQTLSPADDAALQEAAFQAAVAAAMPQGGDVAPDQRLAVLAKLYQEQLGMAPAYPVSENPADIVNANITFLEQALRPKYTPAPAAREALARARADAVQAAVLTGSEIMPDRVFLVARPSAKAAEGGGARMELALQ